MYRKKVDFLQQNFTLNYSSVYLFEAVGKCKIFLLSYSITEVLFCIRGNGHI